MNRIRVGFFSLLMMFSLFAISQQRPHFTQYIMNNFIVNPAVAGIENYWDVKASHRMQWVGLTDAPVTTYVTIHGPFTKGDYNRETPTTVHSDVENPRGTAYWDEYTKPAPHLGFGATFVNDRTGPLKTNNASASLAYHFGISPKTSLSIGLSFGFNQMTIDQDKLHFAETGDNVLYSDISNNLFNKVNTDAAAGIWLYSSDYFIGISAQQLLGNNIDFYNPDSVSKRTTGPGILVPHYFASAGVRMFLSEDWNVLPSMNLRYVSPLPLGIDANVKFQYKDLFWFGGSYRYQDGFAGMVGMNLNNNINIGYSYDVTTSQLNTVSKGTHELLIGFLLGNKWGDWCPRNLW
jgi:type IX secretion system PorP/SprF family membrane protein